MSNGLNMELINKFYDRLKVNVDFDVIDKLVMSDANILRPVVGHAFEYNFSKIVKDYLGGDIEDAGGDTDVDLIIIGADGNKYPAQAKTLNRGSTKENVTLAVNLHKTHGTEKRPQNLYPMVWPCPLCQHDGEEFPPFLIIPHPTQGVLIVPKQAIPENPSFPGHFADPAYFNWNSEWLNRWDLVGFPNKKGKKIILPRVSEQPILTRVCEAVNLTYEELLSLWLEPKNFRMIDMNLRGNLREPTLEKIAIDAGIKVEPPIGRYPKYDRFLNGIKVQIKGCSKALSSAENSNIGVEVMGSHGKGAVRRYSEGEFEYLAIVIESNYLNPNLGLDMTTSHFAVVPAADLPLHYRNGYEWEDMDKIYDRALFDIKKDPDGSVFLYPAVYPTKYKWEKEGKSIERVVKFRNRHKYRIDSFPSAIKNKKTI